MDLLELNITILQHDINKFNAGLIVKDVYLTGTNMYSNSVSKHLYKVLIYDLNFAYGSGSNRYILNLLTR